GWDSIKDRILYDKDIYNPDSNEWLREPKPNRPAEPTNYEVYEVFSKMLGVNHDVETGFIRVNVEHYVPKLAYDWVGLLTQELNRHFQSRDISDATRNIEYLRGKINETGIAEMQSVFYRMIESQMKTLMLAEVSGEYLVKSVVAASLPEIKSKPNRVLICLLGVVLGGMLSVILIFVFHFFRDDDASVSSR
ncbi:MAG TPA: hypothetical protein VL943_09625, partial [Niabella sp.]|nr:hypothetical protein [Niabella sp.]